MVKVKFTIEQAIKARKGGTSTAVLISNLDARFGWVVNATLQAALPAGQIGT